LPPLAIGLGHDCRQRYVSDLIDRLETQAGFFVSERVKAIILRAAGEMA